MAKNKQAVEGLDSDSDPKIIGIKTYLLENFNQE